MNEDELSDIIKKISGMIGSNNSSDNSSNSGNTADYNNSNNYENSTNYNYNTSNSNNFDNSTTFENSNNSEGSNSNFNIDFETLLKIKTMMDKMNSHQDNSRSNLLLSLKPYLNDTRKDKVDQYIKLLNMSDMLEIFMHNDNNGGESNK